MKYLLITITLFSFSSLIYSQEQENLILVTLDGVRWQEIFYGIDPNIIIKLEKRQIKFMVSIIMLKIPSIQAAKIYAHLFGIN